MSTRVGFRGALHRARSGQPPRLAGQQSDQCPSRRGRLGHRRLHYEGDEPPSSRAQFAPAGAPVSWCCFTAGWLPLCHLSTAYVIPTYLQTLQNYRSLDIGAVLIWIAAPRSSGPATRHADPARRPRWTLIAGTALVAVACLMLSQLTGAWSTGDFLPSQILQAVGQSLALTPSRSRWSPGS